VGRPSAHVACSKPKSICDKKPSSTEDTFTFQRIGPRDKVNVVEAKKRVQTRLSCRNPGRNRRRPSGLVEGLQ